MNKIANLTLLHMHIIKISYFREVFIFNFIKEIVKIKSNNENKLKDLPEYNLTKRKSFKDKP
jgi:hypothetical protein